MKMLIEIANKFLTTIIESIEQIPYGIRWICKQIRSLTKVNVCLFIYLFIATIIIIQLTNCSLHNIMF